MTRLLFINLCYFALSRNELKCFLLVLNRILPMYLILTNISSTAIKYPNQPSTICFQSSGFTDGVIEESELSEEVLEQENMEASEDEEELTEDEGDEEECDVDSAEEVNLSFRFSAICFSSKSFSLLALIKTGVYLSWPEAMYPLYVGPKNRLHKCHCVGSNPS